MQIFVAIWKAKFSLFWVFVRLFLLGISWLTPTPSGVQEIWAAYRDPRYARSCIVCTNVAESGVTIPNVLGGHFGPEKNKLEPPPNSLQTPSRPPRPPPVVYVPALKRGPATVGSEVLMQEALLLHLSLAMPLLGSSPNPFFCAQQVLDPLEHRQRLCIRKAWSLVQRDASCFMLVQNQTTFSASHVQAYWAHLDHAVYKNEVSEHGQHQRLWLRSSLGREKSSTCRLPINEMMAPEKRSHWR